MARIAAAKPPATQNAVRMASMKRKSPVTMSPLMKSRKELVRMTPGMSSMMLPIMMASRLRPGPAAQAAMQSRPARKEMSAWAKSGIIRIRSARSAARASRGAPPKKRVKAAPIMAAARHWVGTG